MRKALLKGACGGALGRQLLRCAVAVHKPLRPGKLMYDANATSLSILIAKRLSFGFDVQFW